MIEYTPPSWTTVKNRIKSKEKEQKYYNKERTSNPYVYRLIETPVENLSSNFHMGDIGPSSNCIWASTLTGIYIVDAEMFNKSADNFKDQLQIKGIKVVDIDELLTRILVTDPRMDPYEIEELNRSYITWAVNQIRLRYINKVAINITNKTISKKRPKKPRPAKDYSKAYSLFKSYILHDIGVYFTRLGLDVSVKMSKQTAYDTITFFKKALGNISYVELAPHRAASINTIPAVKFTANLWSNPEPLKLKKK